MRLLVGHRAPHIIEDSRRVRPIAANSPHRCRPGERALTALALLLSLLEAHPSPICVLDEVDAALDETNVGRFVEALKALALKTQFIIVTHNPRTIEAADVIYGVSMGADNNSKVLSLRLSDTRPALGP